MTTAFVILVSQIKQSLSVTVNTNLGTPRKYEAYKVDEADLENLQYQISMQFFIFSWITVAGGKYAVKLINFDTLKNDTNLKIFDIVLGLCTLGRYKINIAN